jgi:hypothetical protein
MGTKSLLFGYHAFWWHPWWVALAWWRLYGFPWDVRLWLAFIVHDWGYWGLDNMDSVSGKNHPYFGGRIMAWFGMREFTICHSRFIAQCEGLPISRLCVADKMAFCIQPFVMVMTRLSGEIKEYSDGFPSEEIWFQQMTSSNWKWIHENRNV